MSHQSKGPGGCNAGAFNSRSPSQPNSQSIARPATWLEVAWPDLGVPVRFHGRDAQTLFELIRRGPRGLTSGEASPLGWARRTSAYVFKLRSAGLEIVTTRERLSDDVSIGRYTLITAVVIVASHGLK